MCSNPLVILSQNTFQFVDSFVHLYYNSVDLGNAHIFQCSHVTDFLNTYKSLSKEFVYDVIRNSYFFINGIRYPLFCSLPCGRCDDCKFNYQEEIKSRALVEAANSGSVLFYTLTYDTLNDCVSLNKSHVVESFKRLRQYINRFIDDDLHFVNLYIGEYGTDPRYALRPHYHGLLFFNKHLDIHLFNKIKDLFNPKESHLHKCLEKNPKLIYKLRSKGINASSFYSVHKRLKGFWSFGVIYDLQICRNPLASVNYLCKYITKNLINIDSFAVLKERDESHWVAPFIQLPKRYGLGTRHLYMYKNYIMFGRSPRLQLKYVSASGHVLFSNIKVPRLFINKLFPSVGSLCPSCVINAHIVKSLLDSLDDFSLSVDEYAYVNKGKYSNFDEKFPCLQLYCKNIPLKDLVIYSSFVNFAGVHKLKQMFQPYLYLTKFSLKRKEYLKVDFINRLIINSLHNCHYLSYVLNNNLDDEIELDVCKIIELYIDKLKPICNFQSYHNLTTKRLCYFNTLDKVELSYSQISQLSQNKLSLNKHYVESNMLYSPFNTFC